MITRSVTRPVLRNVARSQFDWRGAGFPSALALLWPLKLSDAGVLRSAKGPAPTFTDTPTVTADGVAPGDGPTWPFDPSNGIWPPYTQMAKNSKFVGAVGGAPGTVPTNWTLGASGAAMSVDGERLVISAANKAWAIRQSYTVLANTVYYFSTEFEISVPVVVSALLYNGTTPSGATWQYIVDGVNVANSYVVPAGVHSVCRKLTVAATGGNPAFFIGLDSTSITGTVIISRPMVTTAYGVPYVATGVGENITAPSAPVDWTKGGCRVMKFQMDTASADITDPVELGGGFWAPASGLEFRDGTNTASVATSWDEDEVVTVVMSVDANGIRVGRGA